MPPPGAPARARPTLAALQGADVEWRRTTTVQYVQGEGTPPGARLSIARWTPAAPATAGPHIAEAALTEIPEHLLARSRARRGGGAGAEASTTPVKATSAEAAPAASAKAAPAASAAPVAKKAEPVPPWVEAANGRRKMPVWATAALAFLPLFGVMYMTTNDDPPVTTLGPLTTGATVFSTNCAGCHGATGGGGAGPALSGGAVLGTFADPADQVRWVLLGSANWDGGTYGDTKKALKGGMPGWATLTAGELLAVVRHERETLSGEEYDAEAWQAAVDKLKADANPTVAAAAEEYQAVIDEWATLPAGT